MQFLFAILQLTSVCAAVQMQPGDGPMIRIQFDHKSDTAYNIFIRERRM
jgi:hypothetical protein